MRILIVVPEYPPHDGGGILSYYREMAPALAAEGGEVTVLVAAPTSPDFGDYEHQGVRAVCVPQAECEATSARLPQFSAAPEFRRWLAGALAAGEIARRLGPWDVVEAVDFGLGFVPFIVDHTGPPLVVHLHGSLGQIADHEPRRSDRLLDATLARLAEGSLLPFADALSTCSAANAREWKGRLRRSVGTARPPIGAGAAPEWESGDAIVVAGRIQAWKGPRVLCEAVRLLPESLPTVRWIGRDTPTGSDGGSLSAELARDYPGVWGTRVVAAGPQSREEAGRAIARARLVVVPSDWDVFNLSAVEAMAAARVVVCSSRAGAADLIAPGENGILFEGGDARSLAEAIDAAVSMPADERRRMGAAARQTVVAELEPRALARSRLEVYRGLVSAGSAGRVPVADWARAAFSADGHDRVGPAFLDQMSLRDLSRYLRRRLRDRVANAVGGRSS